MAERRYLDPAEFRRLGLLQEVNRCFFHPLGLALSVRIIETDWEEKEVRESPWMAEKLDAVAEALDRLGLYHAQGDPIRGDDLRERARAVCAALWPEGSTHLADVWDSREDPEGFYFADWIDAEYVRRVDKLRLAHWRARCQMFGNEHALYEKPEDDLLPEEPPDVQAIDWQPPEAE